MIKNEREYQEMLARLEKDKEFINMQLETLKGLGLDEVQMQRAMEPAYSFHEQLKEEVLYYEKIKRGEFDAITNFYGLGKLLIAIRIAKGLSQREMAEKLGVNESQISRDERNEYYGITVERAKRIMDCLGVVLVSEVREIEPPETGDVAFV